MNSKHNSQNKKTCPKTKTCSCLIFLLFKNKHFEVRNQQTWTEKQKSKHNNQNKTNHVRKQKHALVWYFCCLKTTILKWETNKLELKNKIQKTQWSKNNKPCSKTKTCSFWYFLSKNNHIEAINKFQKPNGVIYGNHFFWQRFRIFWQPMVSNLFRFMATKLT